MGSVGFLTHPYPSQEGILRLVCYQVLFSKPTSPVKGTKTPLLGAGLLHSIYWE